jgi:hypothetical protein
MTMRYYFTPVYVTGFNVLPTGIEPWNETMPLGEFIEVNELEAETDEIITALETTGKYVFDAGSNGDSDLVTVTLA